MAKFKSHAERRTAMVPIVRAMHREGKSLWEISKRTGIARSTIASWILRRNLGIPAVGALAPDDELRAAIARLESIYLEAMDAWDASKSGKTVETSVAVDENNFVRAQHASRRVTTTSHGDAAYLYVAIRAVETCIRTRAILNGRPPAGELDRLMLLSEEAFVRRVRELSDAEMRALEAVINKNAPKNFAIDSLTLKGG